MNPYLIGTLIAAIVTPEPNTGCPTCWRVEANRFHRLWKNPPRESNYKFLFYAAPRGPTTWYEKHRGTYVSTGDPIELERMLRHVDTIPV